MKQQNQSPSLIAGANLKRLINENGLTQDEAAKLLFYSDARQIRRLITKGISKIDEIQRIANSFGVPLSALIPND